jgi:hypothetical protein
MISDRSGMVSLLLISGVEQVLFAVERVAIIGRGQPNVIQ